MLRSPLEHDPALIAGVGLITVRWAMLEHHLAELLGHFMAVDRSGDAAYYALGNFTQRLDLIDSVASYSLVNPRHAHIARSIFNKIRRLWKSRNYLIHSHYVHSVELRDGSEITLMLETDREMSNLLEGLDPDNIKWHGFAYIRQKPDGHSEQVRVNYGSFKNHADQLSKRARNVASLTKAIDTKLAKLQGGARTTYRAISPRSPLYPQEIIPEGGLHHANASVTELDRDRGGLAQPRLSVAWPSIAAGSVAYV